MVLAFSGLILLTGCGLTHVQDLSFRIDRRLHFTSPANLAKLHQPVTVRWTMHDFRVAAEGSETPSPDAGYFGVFVDRAPVEPGQTMRAVASGDDICLSNPHCPDVDYL